ncbi:MAG: bifunctional DNA-formamidopyrimidine glycosylase/DNA-(apurinic or apyrimidinic site) lyase [Chloroflexota bacterium]|nr:bifunctional DNA-formamidopyrimidine glycosylase/DNA-(apurinic or apyrimidinic site) lyase [Chloroflexota bacterium]
MPELPEVETVVRGLRAPLVGRTVLGVWHDWQRTLRTPDPESFAARIVGQTFRAVGRRAKYILCQMDDDILVVHLKMTGRLYVTADSAVHDADRWVHFRAQLDGGQQLRFSDARKFGFVALVRSLDEIAPLIGPEPLEDDFTADVLRQRLRGHRKAIKALLLDQAVLAGVGNIYADESLWRAGIHPLRPSDSLSDAEVALLHSAIRESLAGGIDHEGASINWYRKPDGTAGEAQEHFFVYDRAGQPCQRCTTPIVKTRVAQRGTHYCPACQRLEQE